MYLNIDARLMIYIRPTIRMRTHPICCAVRGHFTLETQIPSNAVMAYFECVKKYFNLDVRILISTILIFDSINLHPIDHQVSIPSIAWSKVQVLIGAKSTCP